MVKAAMKVKVSELNGAALDWAVALATGYDEGWLQRQMANPNPATRAIPTFSTDWSEGGPLLKPNRISIEQKHSGWALACIYNINDDPTFAHLAHDPLVAAMRCLVASKHGEWIDVPDELWMESMR